MAKYYITTTLPYVNAEPHLGFAMEIVRADFLARFHKLLGDEVVFNTGTDEHGVRIYKIALEQGKNPQDFVDEYAAKFDDLKNYLNLSYTNFTRTTNTHHVKAAQEFWKRCFENGDIYKAKYQIKYCIGCELEKTDSELIDDKCLIHPKLELEIREEENYFFKWSKYQKPLLDFYNSHPNFVIPEFRFKEIKQFVKNGLQDFSISRLKEKMPWGVEVPDDPEHIMYVWFDALVNYISVLGWPEDENKFNSFWPGIQIAGKDNLRQQTAMWQAMLISAGLPNSKQILIQGFVLSSGQKMSKSLGNVIHPFDLVKKYSTDAVRFFIGKELAVFEDSDVTPERLEESYNAELANGLGNLVARVAKLCEQHAVEAPVTNLTIAQNVTESLEQYKFNEALNFIWSEITGIDKKINQEKPWELSGEKVKETLLGYVKSIQQIAFNLLPFLPETADKILKQFSGSVRAVEPLFPRIN